ncbi:uncharacterized protein [Miscanthus floridulus]|uniref:uncharacterized protein isoform X4 n=1 Tax=Miscanthus floridulus TaxID=154761 RepID=UPI0034578758
MRNSELGCGGTEQRRGVAVALSCGDAAAQGRWRGEAVTLWRGAANWAARDATGSARGPARRLMTSAKKEATLHRKVQDAAYRVERAVWIHIGEMSCSSYKVVKIVYCCG